MRQILKTEFKDLDREQVMLPLKVAFCCLEAAEHLYILEASLEIAQLLAPRPAATLLHSVLSPPEGSDRP